jgi:hypothetical protein
MVETHIVHSLNHFPRPYAGHPKGWRMKGPAAGWENYNLWSMKKQIFWGFICFILILISSMSLSGQVDKGTLMGNEQGTKFCCAAGNNDCGAARCKEGVDIE